MSSWGIAAVTSSSRGARISMLSVLGLAVSSPLGGGDGDPSSRCREEGGGAPAMVAIGAGDDRRC